MDELNVADQEFFWYYSVKRHAVGAIENEFEAQRIAQAKVPGLIIFSATGREMEWIDGS